MAIRVRRLRPRAPAAEGEARGLGKRTWPARRLGRPADAGRPEGGVDLARAVDEIEARWEERFGADAVDELREGLRAIVSRIDVDLPDFLPIVGSANGMAADLPLRERTDAAVPDMS